MASLYVLATIITIIRTLLLGYITYETNRGAGTRLIITPSMIRPSISLRAEPIRLVYLT